jgi:hypothetical protein
VAVRGKEILLALVVLAFEFVAVSLQAAKLKLNPQIAAKDHSLILIVCLFL